MVRGTQHHSSVAFSEEIDAAEAAIAQRPEAWPQFQYGTRRYLLRRFPFSIIYRIEPTRLLILAIAHGHRRPGYWKHRGTVERPDA